MDEISSDCVDLKQENEELRERIAELEQYKTLHKHALDCVDRVFQVCTEIPNPILPNFAKLGEDKFRAVIRLAKAYKELERDSARWKECERLAERFKGATGATFWEMQPAQGDTFAAAIDASIAARGDE